MLAQFIAPGILLVLTLGLGFWLSHIGKPYNGILFNIHKLLALGAVVMAAMQLTHTFKTINSSWWIIALFVLVALCVIALFASGALLSMEKLDYALMLTVHRVAPVLLVIVMALAVYLLAPGKL